MEDFKKVDFGEIFADFFINREVSKDSVEICKITKEQAKKGIEIDNFKISTADVCEVCHGIKNSENKCKKCYDRGFYFTEKNIKIKIPKNVSENDYIVYKGKGNQLNSNEPRGDLYIKIHIYGNKPKKEGNII